MPLRLSSLKKSLRTITMEWDDNTLNVTYRLGEVTPERADRLAAMFEESRAEDRSNAEIWADILAVVESWDILGDDGNPLPVTAETLAQIPITILRGIAEEITEDARPMKKKSRASGGRSFAQ
ncbi:MAG: hypothetical protein BPHS0_15 [Phage 5P_3]|nr:MAG: hypothetical protein BPHS0_15 [Phage 5P_3]